MPFSSRRVFSGDDHVIIYLVDLHTWVNNHMNQSLHNIGLLFSIIYIIYKYTYILFIAKMRIAHIRRKYLYNLIVLNIFLLIYSY